MSLLDGVEGVRAFEELFLRRPRDPNIRKWDSDAVYPRFVETKPKRVPLRPFSVFSYLNQFYGQPGLVGFKLMYGQLQQNVEILLYLILHRVPVVHLVRQNHLDVVISLAVRRKLGYAHVLSGQTAPRDVRVRLDTEGLLKQLKRLEREQRVARCVLRWTRLPHVEVTYEDLVQDQNAFGPIWDLLSIDSSVDLPASNLVRIRKGRHPEVVENYDDVIRALINSRFSQLLDSGGNLV